VVKPIFKVKNSSQIYIIFLNKGLNYACIRDFFNTNVYLYKEFSLRYGFVLLTLFILSNSFSLALAQSIYQFKEKSTNVGQHNSENYQNIKLTPKIRFRYLYGTFNSDSQEATRSTSSIILHGWGIGQSFFKYKASISGYTIDLENTTIDLSYTFGDEYTLTLGSSAVYMGDLTVTTSDSEIYNSSNVEGYGYFGILGVEYGIFEILLGYQYISYAFIELESESTSSSLGRFRNSRSLYVTGIGLVF
jgi:hypothetical protein